MTDAHEAEVHQRRHSELRGLHRVDDGLAAALQRVVDDVVRHIDAADHASVSQEQRRSDLSTVAASDDVAAGCNHAQVEVGEGPCLTALHDHRTVVVDDWELDERWPRVRPAYLSAGVRSSLSIELYLDETAVFGTLTLLSRSPRAFDLDATIVAEHFAVHAAAAVHGAAHRDQMNTALASRDVIGQAKGIIMERYQVTADQAFQVLVRHSRTNNLKLTDVAAGLAHRGELPG